VGLVFAIVVVLNFLNFNHHWKKDLTENKIHSISDQTKKALEGLQEDLNITVFVKAQERERAKSFFGNYTYLTKKVKVEYVDPDRDPQRAKALNVKKYNTAIVALGKKDTRVDDYTEEKVTNAIMKLMKTGVTRFCLVTGHGEKLLDNPGPDGLGQLKQELESQNFEVQSLNLLEEGKIPEGCTVVAVVGPEKAFFEKEIELIDAWLKLGGRLVLALDPPVRSNSVVQKELIGLADKWAIEFRHNLIVDPTSKLLGGNASVPLVGTYNKDHPIVKDFQIATLFPLPSGVDVKSTVPGMKTWWVAKTTQRSIAKSDFKEIATGRVKVNEKTDKVEAHAVMAAVEGRAAGTKPDARPARIVAFGTSNLVNNAYARHGANMDLFMNSLRWLADEESFISIKSREDGPVIPSLSQEQGRAIQFATMFLVPGGSLLWGLAIWLRRRKL